MEPSINIVLGLWFTYLYNRLGRYKLGDGWQGCRRHWCRIPRRRGKGYGSRPRDTPMGKLCSSLMCEYFCECRGGVFRCWRVYFVDIFPHLGSFNITDVKLSAWFRIAMSARLFFVCDKCLCAWFNLCFDA